jgi:KaiC/GvpD/RAD55 family RecA-like ATPase
MTPAPQSTTALIVALHHAHHNKVFATPGKDCPDASYRNAELDALGLADHISTGFAWVACHLAPHPSTGEVGWRNEEAYIQSNLAVLDIDGDMFLGAFWNIPFVRKHCLFTATSCSHNPAGEHRFRAVFQFIPTSDTVGLHRHIVLALEDALGFAPKDTAGRKPERLWYGNDRAEITFGGGEILPAELIFNAQDSWAEEQRRAAMPRQAPSASQDLMIRQATWLLSNPTGLRPSQDGEYNDVWLKVLGGAASANDDGLWAAFLSWHSASHHRRKNSVRKCERERNKLQRFGIEAIFGVAARIMGNDWRRVLPPELREPRKVIEPPTMLIRSAAPVSGDDVAMPTPRAEHPEAPQGGPQILVSSSIPNSLSMKDIARYAAHEHGSEEQGDVTLEDLIDRVYRLTCHGLHKHEGGLDQIDDPEQIEQLIRHYTNQLYAYPIFARNPAELNRALLSRFRRDTGYRPRRVSNIRPLRIGEGLRPAGPVLIPGLIESGRTYLLYGKAGTGKTTFAMMLARAVIGTPGHRKFLDYEEVSPAAWRTRRVLIIGSDGGDGARTNFDTYANWHHMKGQEWEQRYLTTITSSAEEGTPIWKMELPHLIRLIETLDEAQREGIPYNLVIFDSLKTICPPGTKVGDQVITEYLDTIAAICAARQVAQLYIHHQSRDSEDPQGVTGLTEITDGNFQLKRDENNLHTFNVVKSRAQWNAHRNTPYTIERGEIRAGLGGATDQQVDGETFLLRVIQDHLEEHRNRTSILPAESDARVYRGLKPTEIPGYMEEKGLRHPDLGSRATVARKVAGMIEDGRLVWTNGNRNTRGLVPYGIDPRIINSDQGELDGFADYIDDPEEDDVP